MKNNEKILAVVLAIVVPIVSAIVVIAAFCTVYFMFGAKPVIGEKNITIEVVNSKKENVVYQVNTDAEFLKGAMEDAENLEFSGTADQYGLTLKTVNGEYADFVSAYWATYVNGEYCLYGIDSQPVNDGDAFKIEYTPIG